MRNTRLFRLGVAILLLLVAAPAVACPVCYGDTESPIIDGAEMAVWFMVGVTYLLMVGGGVLFFLLRRRAVRAQRAAAQAQGA